MKMIIAKNNFKASKRDMYLQEQKIKDGPPRKGVKSTQTRMIEMQDDMKKMLMILENQEKMIKQLVSDKNQE